MRWEFGEYQVDAKLFELRCAGKSIQVRRMPLRLLIHLAENASRAVPTEELARVLWPGLTVTDASLRQVVRALRRSLGPGGAERIVSVKGFGYRLQGPIRLLRTDDAPEAQAAVKPLRAFVGRQEELQLLRTAAELAMQGKGQMVWLTGPPGLGKTRLAEELSSSVPPSMRTVWGRCWEDGGSPPFWPWDEILRGVVGESERLGADLNELLLERRPERGSLQPSRSEDPQARFRLFAAFASLVRRRAEVDPLLIVLDDLHAVEEPALLLLKYFARELPSCRVLVVGTYRAEEMRSRPRCAQILDRVTASAATVALNGLDLAAVRDCLEAATQRDVSQTVVSNVHQICGGNPLFLHELIRIYGDQLVQGVPELTELAQSPTTIREAIRRHARALSARALEMMKVGAILGTDFELSVVGHVLSWSTDEVVRCGDEAVSAGLARDASPGHLRFAHALIRDFLAHELDAVERRDLHRRSADALESLGRGGSPRSIAAIAHHLVQSLPDPVAARRAIVYLSRAAETASARMAHEEARRYCRAALELLEEGPKRDGRSFDIMIRLVDAERLCGATADARETAAAAVAWARQEGSPEQLGDAVCAYGRAHPEVGFIDHTLMAAFEEALARLPRQATAQRVTISARLAVLLSFSHGDQRCLELSAQALADARLVGHQATLGRALASRIFCLIGRPDPDARRVLAEAHAEAVAVSRTCDDPDVTLDLLGWAHLNMLGQGRIEDAREELLRLEQLSQVARRPVHEWYVKSIKAARAIWEGEYAAGEALAADALDFGTRMELSPAQSYYGGQLFQIRRDQGRLGELLPMLQQQAAAFPTMAIWRAGLALAYAETGDADAARAELERACHREFDDLIYDMHWLPVTTLFALVSAWLGDRPSVTRLYSLLQPLGAGVVTSGAVTVALGIGDHTLGQLAFAAGNPATAADHFRAALQLTQRMGATPWIARAQAGLSAALYQMPGGSSRAEALALARRARATAQRLGMAALEKCLEAGPGDWTAGPGEGHADHPFTANTPGA